MLQKLNTKWMALLSLNVALWCVLGFYSSMSAAPQRGQPPFANSVEQRAEIVRQLQELNASLKEQNALLRSGKLQVVIVPTDTSKAP